MQYDDPYADPYDQYQDDHPDDAEQQKSGGDDGGIIAILKSDQVLLGKAVGALVCFIIAIMLVVSTGKTVYAQMQIRKDVIAYFGTEQTKTNVSKPTPASTKRYKELSDKNPDSLIAKLMYGEKLRRIAKYSDAIKVFEDASLLPDELGEGRLGQAAAHLDMAAANPADRNANILRVREILEELDEESVAFDKSVLLAAADLLEGNAGKARSILDASNSDLQERVVLPTRSAIASFDFNRGVAHLMTGSPEECIRSLSQAAQRRGNWPAIGKILKIACINAMKQTDDLKKNQALAKQIEPVLRGFIPTKSRGESKNVYGLRASDRGEIYNAIGLCMFRLGEYLEAKKYFELAGKCVPAKEALPYRINICCAISKAGMSATVAKVKQDLLETAAKQFGYVHSSIKKDPERKELAANVLLQMIALYFASGKNGGLAKTIRSYRDSGHDTAEAFRLEGIFHERNKRARQAKEAYRKAIEAGHADADDLEVRIEALGGE